jgi:hypothetical protein
MKCARFLSVALIGVVFFPSMSLGQGPTPPKPSPIEKLSENVYRVGSIRVDTAKRELSVPGKVNPVMTLEFIANPTDGLKAYESAITLETNAITFNAALLLLGLDPSHGRRGLSRMEGVAGDPVEVWIDTPIPTAPHFRAERLIYSQETKETATDDAWVFTGSSFLPPPDGRYRADADGVLIGFVHDLASIIEISHPIGLGQYGITVLNPTLGLTPGMPVTLTVKATGAPPKLH